MENITIPNDEPVVQSTTVDDSATAQDQFRTVCGITFTAPESITDEEITRYNDKVQSFTKIELRGCLDRLKNDYAMCDAVRVHLESAESSIGQIQESFNGLVKSISTDNIITDVTFNKDTPIDDIDTLKEELSEYRSRVDIAIQLVEKRLKELNETKGYTSIADDITETLLKNRDTLNMSEDINSGLYVKYIDRILDEIKTGYIYADRMWPKLENKKRLLDIAKEFYKDRRKAEREIYSIGFRKSFVDDFISFLCMWMGYREEFIEDAVWLYFYHITKIVKSELKKGNYLSLVYKCYVLQVLELYNTAKAANVGFSDKTELCDLVKHVRSTYYDIVTRYVDGYHKYSK